MSKKANSTMIGLFTLIGITVTVVAVVLLGAGKFFEKTHKVLLYFDKSVYGLQEGSDVRFGGVRIGRVDSISVVIDTRDSKKIIPVVVELTEKGLTSIGGGGVFDFSTKEGVKKAVAQGLRAGMKQQSLVTGQLYIEFDIKPDTEGFVYRGGGDSRYPVVPTIGTEIDELISGITDGLKKINDLDLVSLLDEMKVVLQEAGAKLDDLDLKEINDNVTVITRDMKEFTSDLKELTGDGKLTKTLDNLDAALVELKDLGGKMNENVDPVLEDMRKVAETARESLEKIDQTVGELGKVTDPRSPMLLGLRDLLRDAEVATRELRDLSNDLKRNPESLLRGKEKE